MGRIKTQFIKRISKQLVKEHMDEFTEDFTKNKTVVDQYATITSPKIRNVIAGYVSRLVKKSKEGKAKRILYTEDMAKYY